MPGHHHVAPTEDLFCYDGPVVDDATADLLNDGSARVYSDMEIEEGPAYQEPILPELVGGYGNTMRHLHRGVYDRSATQLQYAIADLVLLTAARSLLQARGAHFLMWRSGLHGLVVAFCKVATTPCHGLQGIFAFRYVAYAAALRAYLSPRKLPDVCFWSGGPKWFTDCLLYRCPPRLENQIQRLEVLPCNVVWIDPLNAGQALPGYEASAPVRSLAAMIGPRDGEIEVTRYSYPGLASTAPARKALTDIFPGLTINEKVMVASASAATLARQLVDLPKPLCVLIDVPGGEAVVIAMLVKSSLLGAVAVLSVRCGIEAYFGRAQPAAKIRTHLETAGFRLAFETDDDPDWPEYVFQAMS